MATFVDRWHKIVDRMDDLEGGPVNERTQGKQDDIEHDALKLGGEAIAQLVDDIHTITKVLNTPQVRRQVRRSR